MNAKPLTTFTIGTPDDTSLYTSYTVQQYVPEGYVADGVLTPPVATVSDTKTLTAPITLTNVPADAAGRVNFYEDSGILKWGWSSLRTA